jgi:hypothetical protein
MRNLSFNLGDIIIAAGCIALMVKDRPLPVIAILLMLILAELGRIRRALAGGKEQA